MSIFGRIEILGVNWPQRLFLIHKWMIEENIELTEKVLKNHYVSKLKFFRPNYNTLPSNGVAKRKNGAIHPLYRFRSESIHHAHLFDSTMFASIFHNTKIVNKRTRRTWFVKIRVKLSSLSAKNRMFFFTSSLPGNANATLLFRSCFV